MAARNIPPVRSVLILIFPGMDLLDMAGPLEAFSRAFSQPGASACFKPTIAGSGRTATAQGVTIAPDIGYDVALAHIETHDILLVPGGPSSAYMPLLTDTNPIVKIIEAFTALGPKPALGSGEQERDRILMSVCTGAFFLAYLGIFNGRECTTHYMTATALQTMLDERAKEKGTQPGKYVRTSWIDSGRLSNGTRIFGAGGITNGIDGALRLVEELHGLDVKARAAAIMDYPEELERPGIISDKQ
jgi:transcriptional regulator GlxA family with amidase domain